MRSRVVRQTRRPDLAFRLIPEHTGDSSYAARAKILFGSLFQDIPADSILPKVIPGAAFKSIAIYFQAGAQDRARRHGLFHSLAIGCADSIWNADSCSAKLALHSIKAIKPLGFHSFSVMLSSDVCAHVTRVAIPT